MSACPWCGSLTHPLMVRGFVTAWGRDYPALGSIASGEVVRFASRNVSPQVRQVAAAHCGPAMAETFREGQWPEEFAPFFSRREPLAASGLVFKRARVRS